MNQEHVRPGAGGVAHCGRGRDQSAVYLEHGGFIMVSDMANREGPNSIARRYWSREAGGVDFLELSIYGGFHPSRWKLVRAALAAGQEAAQDGVVCRKLPRIGTVKFFPFGVKRGGRRSAERGVYCRFGFEKNGVKFLFVDRGEANDSQANVFVEAGSLACMSLGIKGLEGVIEQVLGGLYFKSEKWVPSRVDVCADISMPVKEFVEKFESGCYVARARDSTVHRSSRKATGFSCGKGVRIRIYDKVREVLRPGGGLKSSYLCKHRWVATETSLDATRVEFQLRRKVLRERFGIQDWEQLKDSLGDIAEWCCHKWFRITEREPDEQNTTRCRLAAVWKLVQKAFETAFGEGRGGTGGKIQRAGGVERLAAQAVGVIAAAAGRVGVDIRNGEEFLEFTRRLLEGFSDQGACRAQDRLLERVSLPTPLVPTAVPLAELAQGMLWSEP